MVDERKFAEEFNDIEMFRYCEQCGRCSSACPITGINGFNVRRLVRHVELDLIDEIAGSSMPWFCATCGRCEDACPNGIKIVDIKCPTSNESDKNDLANLTRLSSQDQVKFVIGSRKDYEYAKEIVELNCPGFPRGQILFSPVKGKMVSAKLAEWILEDNLNVRLHLQLHKIIWPGKQRGV